MRQPTILFILFIIPVLINSACYQNQPIKSNKSDFPLLTDTGKGVIPKLDNNDKPSQNIQNHNSDFNTKDGWNIQYFTKEDSTKQRDIYIKCSKGNFAGTFIGTDLLTLRPYFIPTFEGESKSYIYFTHNCSTECTAITVFSKNKPNSFKSYLNVVDYSIKFNQILYITNNSYKNENKIYDLALVDLNTGLTHKITYTNICLDAYKPNCIDTVIFGKNKLTIKTKLLNANNPEQQNKQTRIINF